MVLGVGIDMIEIDRVEETIARFGDRFLARVFTRAERAYCQSKKKGAAQSFALRWAAKEAVAKALGTGIRAGVDFKDIEVVSDRLGRPAVKLSRGASRAAADRRIDRVHLSLSHDGPHAVAFAVAEADGPAKKKTKAPARPRKRSAR